MTRSATEDLIMLYFHIMRDIVKMWNTSMMYGTLKRLECKYEVWYSEKITDKK